MFALFPKKKEKILLKPLFLPPISSSEHQAVFALPVPLESPSRCPGFPTVCADIYKMLRRVKRADVAERLPARSMTTGRHLLFMHPTVTIMTVFDTFAPAVHLWLFPSVCVVAVCDAGGSVS